MNQTYAHKPVKVSKRANINSRENENTNNNLNITIDTTKRVPADFASCSKLQNASSTHQSYQLVSSVDQTQPSSLSNILQNISKNSSKFRASRIPPTSKNPTKRKAQPENLPESNTTVSTITRVSLSNSPANHKFQTTDISINVNISNNNNNNKDTRTYKNVGPTSKRPRVSTTYRGSYPLKHVKSSPIRNITSTMLSDTVQMAKIPTIDTIRNPCELYSLHLPYITNSYIYPVKNALHHAQNHPYQSSHRAALAKPLYPAVYTNSSSSTILSSTTNISIHPTAPTLNPSQPRFQKTSSNSIVLPKQASEFYPSHTSSVKVPLHEFSYLDAEDKNDSLMVSEYIPEIIQYLLENEKKTMPDPNYIIKQSEINWPMRKALVNWVIKVHYQLLMLPETLFIAVNLIDRFLSKRFVAATKFQLVGIVSLFIASKYEEMSTRPIKEFLGLADSAYTENDILTAERFMLRVIDYDLSYSGPLTFLRRVSKADNYNLKNRTVAKYFLEISLVDHSFLCYSPSLIAAASFHIARKVSNIDNWTPTISYLSSYSEAQVMPCVNAFIAYLLNNSSSDILNTKYSQKCYYHASIISHNWASQLCLPSPLSSSTSTPINNATCSCSDYPRCKITHLHSAYFYSPTTTTTIAKTTSRSSISDDTKAATMVLNTLY